MKSNLEGKINGLAQKKFLTAQNAEALHEHRFLGNDALHELTQPSSEELKLAIEIVEHTFKSVFDLPKIHKDLMARRINKNTL